MCLWCTQPYSVECCTQMSLMLPDHKYLWHFYIDLRILIRKMESMLLTGQCANACLLAVKAEEQILQSFCVHEHSMCHWILNSCKAPDFSPSTSLMLLSRAAEVRPNPTPSPHWPAKRRSTSWMAQRRAATWMTTPTTRTTWESHRGLTAPEVSLSHWHWAGHSLSHVYY